MGVVIETIEWEPTPYLYLFLFIASFLSILFSSSRIFNKTSLVTTASHSTSFLRFQRKFLFIYSLVSMIEGLESVLAEFEFAYYGASREQMVGSLCVGAVGSLLVGSLLGVLSDIIGQKKVCLIFCVLHLFVGIWKRITMHPSVWIASICLALASSIFSFSFETWMVKEHDKLGHRQDLLSDTFWLMDFFESASLIGSQVLGNWLLNRNGDQKSIIPWNAVALLSIISFLYVTKEWKASPVAVGITDYSTAFSACILSDKRVWLLATAQACLYFSISIFWILWAPTIVADGREVHLGLIYPCFLGARMLGSTAVPWLISVSSPVRTEDVLIVAFILAGLVFSTVAYDYQEIGVLVFFFCFFHACVGIIEPSLARLRTMYVPNELRGGMISLSLAPGNAALLFILIQAGYASNLENSTIMAFAAFGLFASAGCMHILKRRGKQPYQNWHNI